MSATVIICEYICTFCMYNWGVIDVNQLSMANMFAEEIWTMAHINSEKSSARPKLFYSTMPCV